jgi:hypothetical protein
MKKALKWGKSIRQEFSIHRNVFACEIHPQANLTPMAPLRIDESATSSW